LIAKGDAEYHQYSSHRGQSARPQIFFAGKIDQIIYGSVQIIGIEKVLKVEIGSHLTF
jgi:hypothetical protein